MNKTGFIEKLEKETGYSHGDCIKINSVLEDTFIIGKTNKEKIITKFTEVLEIDEKTAEDLYNKVMGIIGDQIKNKIKHPFAK